MVASGLPSRFRIALLLTASLVLVTAIFVAAMWTFADTILGDFTVTFYRAAEYMLRGENVYFGKYPNPLNGRDYPPYSPIWVVYPSIPFTALPLDVAEALRFLLDVALVPLLAYIATRWTRLGDVRYAALLVLAPWHFIMVFMGNYSALVFLGILLCYWGVHQANAWMIAVGIFFMMIKPHVVLLIILATVIYAWRNGLLVKMFSLLLGMALISSFAQPTWVFDVAKLLTERLARPRFADAVLLLPGYPWSQFSVLATGAVFLLVYLLQSQGRKPTVWLWCVLVCASLLGGLHSFPYDWLNLMLPLAWLLGNRRGAYLVGAFYLYVFAWLFCEFVLQVAMPPVTIIPSAVLVAVLVARAVEWRSQFCMGE
jgi:hypothetical protein